MRANKRTRRRRLRKICLWLVQTLSLFCFIVVSAWRLFFDWQIDKRQTTQCNQMDEKRRCADESCNVNTIEINIFKSLDYWGSSFCCFRFIFISGFAHATKMIVFVSFGRWQIKCNCYFSLTISSSFLSQYVKHRQFSHPVDTKIFLLFIFIRCANTAAEWVLFFFFAKRSFSFVSKTEKIIEKWNDVNWKTKVVLYETSKAVANEHKNK